MFELNAKYQQELTMYILAGKKRLAQIQACLLYTSRCV